jgi:hypothetical protein
MQPQLMKISAANQIGEVKQSVAATVTTDLHAVRPIAEALLQALATEDTANIEERLPEVDDRRWIIRSAGPNDLLAINRAALISVRTDLTPADYAQIEAMARKLRLRAETK